MKFYAVVWCPDCNGIDFQGCFDGGVERLGPFDSRVEAEQEGKKEAELGGIWKFDVEEEKE